MESAIAEFQERICVARFEGLGQMCAEAALLIHEGAVLAWYRGRMEFGPRERNGTTYVSKSFGPLNGVEGRCYRRKPAIEIPHGRRTVASGLAPSGKFTAAGHALHQRAARPLT
jgi:hypothetical protein